MKKEMSLKKQSVLFIAMIAGVVLFDQGIKYWASGVLQYLPGKTMAFIPGFMNLHYVENTGAAFSLFSNATWLLALLSAVMACVVIWFLWKYRTVDSWLYKLSMCFIAGGAIGNLIDRVFLGYVVDMLEFDFIRFAVFNVADSFVCVGAVMLGIFIIWFWDKHKKEKDVQED